MYGSQEKGGSREKGLQSLATRDHGIKERQFKGAPYESPFLQPIECKESFIMDFVVIRFFDLFHCILLQQSPLFISTALADGSQT